jgi:Rrf2 family transcriptional regulator, nitric oxide-sensitive transcriptional repressor
LKGVAVRLTKYTDYALRVLMYVAARPERQSSVGEIARAYGISQNHLTKVVHNLGKAGYIATTRGRFGGLRLLQAESDINVGEVVRRFEDGFDLVDCGSCVIAPSCQLQSGLDEAVRAFLAVLDGYTLADLMTSRGGLARLLDVSLAASPVDHR